MRAKSCGYNRAAWNIPKSSFSFSAPQHKGERAERITMRSFLPWSRACCWRREWVRLRRRAAFARPRWWSRVSSEAGRRRRKSSGRRPGTRAPYPPGLPSGGSARPPLHQSTRPSSISGAYNILAPPHTIGRHTSPQQSQSWINHVTPSLSHRIRIVIRHVRVIHLDPNQRPSRRSNKSKTAQKSRRLTPVSAEAHVRVVWRRLRHCGERVGQPRCALHWPLLRLCPKGVTDDSPHAPGPAQPHRSTSEADASTHTQSGQQQQKTCQKQISKSQARPLESDEWNVSVKTQTDTCCQWALANQNSPCVLWETFWFGTQ